MRLILLSLLALAACAPKAQNPYSVDPEINAKVIYGNDDRKDVYQVNEAWKQVAKSTVALMKATDLTGSGGSISLSSASLGSQMGLCTSEPFYAQPAAAFCSGSLVGPDLVLTAGHCVRTASDCASTRFVFDYALLGSATDFPTQTQSSKVFACTEIVRREEQSSGFDYALIRLDRPVSGRAPLRIRRSGELSVGDGVTVVGHPSGLPTKVASAGAVRSTTATHYVTNLDTYGGNSGSAVFNTSTLEIEGILVRGENDYVPQGSCYVSNRCPSTGCRGEDVTRVSVVADLIPNQGNPTTTTTTTSQPPPTTTAPPPSTTTTTQAPPEPNKVEFTATPNLAIPDKNTRGVESTLNADQAPNGRKVQISVEITHSYVGDLQITLTDPVGKKYILQKNKLGRQHDLVGTYGADLKADSDLSVLSKVTVVGAWKLKVADTAAIDTGILKRWKLSFK